jgi:hypothetical protein
MDETRDRPRQRVMAPSARKGQVGAGARDARLNPGFPERFGGATIPAFDLLDARLPTVAACQGLQPLRGGAKRRP